MTVLQRIDAALAQHGAEARAFCGPLAETRYERAYWPTLGQYDYFCGQVLYSLIRASNAKLVVEVSTSSGYSTCITAAALKANGGGTVHSFDIDAKAQAAAQQNLARFGLQDQAQLHLGDARVLVAQHPELKQADVFFLDSLHTAAFARQYMETLLTEAKPEALFHIHDCLPWHARVRRDGTAGSGLVLNLKRWIYDKYISAIPDEERVKVTVRPAENGGLATYNGLETMEAALANELCARMPQGQAVFLHDIADAHPDCEPRRFDAKVLARESAAGKPFEWNDAFWCSAPQAWTAYQAWKAAGAVLRTTQPA